VRLTGWSGRFGLLGARFGSGQRNAFRRSQRFEYRWGQQRGSAAVAFYAPVDFLGEDARAKGAPQAMTFLLGDDRSDARLASMSPLSYAGPRFPPTMLVTGNRDELVHWGESLKMYRALIDAGAPTEIHIFDGAPHAFDLLPDFGRQCAGLLTLFLDSHVAAPRPLVIPAQPG
jgi:acetyl esterase/lipase